MTMIVEGVQLSGTRKIIIPATVNAVPSDPIELRDLVNYTVTSTTLGVGEAITAEIYDFSQTVPVWQPYMYSGVRVKLEKNVEQLQLSGSAILIRFTKTVTASPVGLTLSYR